MKLLLVLTLILISTISFGRGNLLLIGGGNRSKEILKQMVSLASGNILIVPLASSIPDEVSESARKQLAEMGAEDVQVFSCDRSHVDTVLCLSEIRNANLIYFTGGSQNDLMKAFEGSSALALMKKRFAEKLHLAGTSAGTAIMSDLMLTGNAIPPYERLEGVRQNMVEVLRGFGFVKSFIIDQHFLKRNRRDRLLSAVLDQEPHVGVGIDESTAIIVESDESFRVIGDSQVMVLDARKASTSVRSDGTYIYRNVVTTLLAPGTTFKLP